MPKCNTKRAGGKKPAKKMAPKTAGKKTPVKRKY